jgi:oxygen-independent coproporphyrinogen-3 oxidase
LKRNPRLKKISSLYIHVPFCVRKCIYCDFFSVHYNEATAKRYIDALCKELLLKRSLASTLKTIYIGGGTPSLLPAESFRKLLTCIKDNFRLSSDAEITVEVNPGTIDKPKIDALLPLGINRFSIGIQSFDDNELSALGRIHTSGDSIRLLEMLKGARMHNFSIDLIYGIPGQTMASWQRSLRIALECSPPHISTYELTPEKGTALHKAMKTGSTKIPDEDLILEMYDHTIDYLSVHGYEHYEISNFALPDCRCMHNVNYWERGGYIGAGAAAHSFVDKRRSMNIKDVDRYIETVNEGSIPETESTRITSTEALKEFIFLGLRKTEGINIAGKLQISRLPMDKNGNLHNAFLKASEELVDEGLANIDRDHLRLTRKGTILSNTVIVRLFEKLGL